MCINHWYVLRLVAVICFVVGIAWLALASESNEGSANGWQVGAGSAILGRHQLLTNIRMSAMHGLARC